MTEGNGIPGSMGPLEVEVFLKGYLRGYRFAVTQLASSYQQLQDQIGQTAGVEDDGPAAEEVDDVVEVGDVAELGFFEDRNPNDAAPLTEEEKARINAKLREMVE